MPLKDRKLKMASSSCEMNLMVNIAQFMMEFRDCR